MNLTTGYYICELKCLFNKGTIKAKCEYNEKTKTFRKDGGDVTRRIVKVIEKVLYEEQKLF